MLKMVAPSGRLERVRPDDRSTFAWGRMTAKRIATELAWRTTGRGHPLAAHPSTKRNVYSRWLYALLLISFLSMGLVEAACAQGDAFGARAEALYRAGRYQEALPFAQR